MHKIQFSSFLITFYIFFPESHKLQYDAITDIASNYLSSTKIALLKFSLALRAYSPIVEMFHQVSLLIKLILCLCFIVQFRILTFDLGNYLYLYISAGFSLIFKT